MAWEWIGIGVALAVTAALVGAFLTAWRKRNSKPPRPSQPYREWTD